MLLRKSIRQPENPASAPARASDLPLSRLQASPSIKALGQGLIVSACLALGVSPAGAQENNPEESDIIYADFPLDDLPEGGGGSTPYPIGDQPLGAVPEPGTLALLLAAAAGAGLLTRRYTRQI